MIKKTIAYEDFNGQAVTEDFYFNFSKAELMDMMDLEAGLNAVIKSGDPVAILNEYKKIILMAYGVKTEDGKQFEKTKKLRKAFKESPAFDALFFELASSETAAMEFVNACLPKDLNKLMESVGAEEDTRPAWQREDRAPTPDEVKKMSGDELMAAFRVRAAK